MTAARRVFPSRVAAGIGAAVWLAVAGGTVSDLRSFSWSTTLIGFAALVLMPFLLDLVAVPEDPLRWKKWHEATRWLQFPAALLLMLSGLCAPGRWAAVLATPWILLLLLLAGLGTVRILSRGVMPFWALCRDIGLALVAIGGAWLLADRCGWHPLEFGTDIVQLTAVHFHFAGLVLPVVTGMVLREFSSSRLAAISAGGVMAGVPLVAAGITASQLGHSRVIEFLAAFVLAASAVIMAGFQLRLACNNSHSGLTRLLWAIAGVSLIFGMTLALLYAARSFVSPLPWLDVPWMRALHGTANALGFAFCAVAGWRLDQSQLLSSLSAGPGGKK